MLISVTAHYRMSALVGIPRDVHVRSTPSRSQYSVSSSSDRAGAAGPGPGAGTPPTGGASTAAAAVLIAAASPFTAWHTPLQRTLTIAFVAVMALSWKAGCRSARTAPNLSSSASTSLPTRQRIERRSTLRLLDGTRARALAASARATSEAAAAGEVATSSSSSESSSSRLPVHVRELSLDGRFRAHQEESDWKNSSRHSSGPELTAASGWEPGPAVRHPKFPTLACNGGWVTSSHVSRKVPAADATNVTVSSRDWPGSSMPDWGRRAGLASGYHGGPKPGLYLLRCDETRRLRQLGGSVHHTAAVPRLISVTAAAAVSPVWQPNDIPDALASTLMGAVASAASCPSSASPSTTSALKSGSERASVGLPSVPVTAVQCACDCCGKGSCEAHGPDLVGIEAARIAWLRPVQQLGQLGTRAPGRAWWQPTQGAGQ
ncbi:hypothetical protein TSOC_002664 [Tetrabaena socialis]|uniref:Uncharacterized protein n=1 Tax=Tetrabaena socialis TaxID=47790 RepID=A0A2J8ADI0_9CHLO|nr:hypothetical protein TSOC_002664 [Tetrabaena socialis]|eukprot:PNH10578.1 hypothetical protein TSOC_002664 [Tetrabaena socialis]